MKARLIIADDHPMVCQGLSEMVERTSNLRIVATARDGHQAEHLARTLPADLLILDITLPGQSGIKVLESLRADHVVLPVLVFSMHPANQYVAYLRRAGAQGFIGKEAEGNSVLTAVRRILAGGTSFPVLSNGGADHASGSANIGLGLSARENQVMQFLLRGVSLVDIAAALGISAQTVTTYRRRILDKLEVKNNAELISRVKRAD
jgi:DNA-binding NarL/FixJ family response regulator